MSLPELRDPPLRKRRVPYALYGHWGTKRILDVERPSVPSHALPRFCVSFNGVPLSFLSSSSSSPPPDEDAVSLYPSHIPVVRIELRELEFLVSRGFRRISYASARNDSILLVVSSCFTDTWENNDQSIVESSRLSPIVR